MLGDVHLNRSKADVDLKVEKDLSDDIHIQRIGVPGGWIYIMYVKNMVNGEAQTTQLSTCYVPGRR